ncbi:MAG: twin-arginine translocation signal domain-containing protein [Deltaproteobacteria bacterium]|nr:twin-arginine translocation signal domain-containing protein [Deltaproteobacteria bacterium]
MDITRRDALRMTGAAAAAAGVGVISPKLSARVDGGLPLPTPAKTRERVWKNDGRYFVQDTVDVSELDKGVIRARVDGKWRGFAIRELNNDFVNWNMNKRIEMMDNMMSQNFGIYNDAHNAAVATYGAYRGDSAFSINVAYKGIGWIPTPDHMDEKIKEYEDNAGASMPDKMSIIKSGYIKKEIWRKNVIGSLELYTTKNYETHSFLNQVTNPVSSIVFLDSPPSFKVQTIARLMHPEDPNLTEDEKSMVKWINYAHQFFHGNPPLMVGFIAVAYYVVEQFDNSPWGSTDDAGGHRVVPNM